MKHPHILTLEKMYADFAKGDFAAFLAGCADQATFQVPGRSKLAGKFTKADFVQKYAVKLSELSGGTLRLEVHDVLASDLHATVLASSTLMRAGQKIEMRTVHVWRFENGKPVAWYEYPRDLYKFDEVWS